MQTLQNRDLKHIIGEASMNEVLMLYGAESKEILYTAIEKKIPAIMSYLSKDKWHVAKVLLTDIVGDRLYVETIHVEEKQHPINIQVNQPVGISFKYAYGKFVFDTTVGGLEPSLDPRNGGKIVLAMPDRIGVVQRRSYFRVNVPESLKVNVVLWHRSQDRAACRVQVNPGEPEATNSEARNYYNGRLIDISAGGAQIMVPYENGVNNADEASQSDVPLQERSQCSFGAGMPDFKRGQFIGLRFTPMPYETPLMFSAQVRHILPTADNKAMCLGLQTVGLGASPEGRQVLSRLAGVVEQYYQINRSSAKQQDVQGATNVEGDTFGL